MTAYANAGAASSVVVYDDSAFDAITVVFASGKSRNYEYTAASCGQGAVDAMKRLAAAGSGLNSYISRRKPPFARKW